MPESGLRVPGIAENLDLIQRPRKTLLEGVNKMAPDGQCSSQEKQVRQSSV